MSVHIGQKIKEQIKKRGTSVSELARRISTSRENIYSIFKRETIDTGLLYKIGIALDIDFFTYYADVNSTTNFAEDPEPYLANKKSQMEHENAALKKELESVKSENKFLREINGLLKEKLDGTS